MFYLFSLHEPHGLLPLHTHFHPVSTPVRSLPVAPPENFFFQLHLVWTNAEQIAASDVLGIVRLQSQRRLLQLRSRDILGDMAECRIAF